MSRFEPRRSVSDGPAHHEPVYYLLGPFQAHHEPICGHATVTSLGGPDNPRLTSTSAPTVAQVLRPRMRSPRVDACSAPRSLRPSQSSSVGSDGNRDQIGLCIVESTRSRISDLSISARLPSGHFRELYDVRHSLDAHRPRAFLACFLARGAPRRTALTPQSLSIGDFPSLPAFVPAYNPPSLPLEMKSIRRAERTPYVDHVFFCEVHLDHTFDTIS
jgi:hypothetical protein